MKQSAGLLLYRMTPMGLAVLVVHPSGTYNKNAAWSLPKGERGKGEGGEEGCDEAHE
jgi:predicted NUDIX family NTP pyrophosphohydrolase